MSPQSLWFTWFLGALIGLTAMSIDIVLPALIRIAQDLESRQTITQHIISVFMLGYAVGQLMWGSVLTVWGANRSC